MFPFGKGVLWFANTLKNHDRRLTINLANAANAECAWNERLSLQKWAGNNSGNCYASDDGLLKMQRMLRETWLMKWCGKHQKWAGVVVVGKEKRDEKWGELGGG